MGRCGLNCEDMGEGDLKILVGSTGGLGKARHWISGKVWG